MQFFCITSRVDLVCALQEAMPIFTCLPSLPDFPHQPTNPPTPSQKAAPPFPRGVRRGACMGPCDSCDVWDLRPLSRSLGLGSRKRRRWCGGMRKCRCLSRHTLFTLQQQMQPCGRLACLCPKGSKYVKVRACTRRPAHRLLFSFPTVTFFSSVSSLLITSIRGRASISPSSLLLSPSSSRTRNLHRPARLNLSFSSGARGSGREGEGGTCLFFFSSIEIPLSPVPYPSVKP